MQAFCNSRSDFQMKKTKTGNENDLPAYVMNMCHMLQLHIPMNIEAKNNKAVVWKKGNVKYDEALRLAKIITESYNHDMEARK